MCFRSRMRGGAPLLSAGSPLPGLPGEGPGLAAPLPGAPTFFLDFFFVFGMAAVRGGGGHRLHWLNRLHVSPGSWKRRTMK